MDFANQDVACLYAEEEEEPNINQERIYAKYDDVSLGFAQK